jgi:long-chain acyl-CoA synthetase
MIQYPFDSIRIIGDNFNHTLSTLTSNSKIPQLIKKNLRGQRDLIFIEGVNTKEFFVSFSYLLSQGIPFGIIPPGLAIEKLLNLIEAYKPAMTLLDSSNDLNGNKIYSENSLSAYIYPECKKIIHPRLASLIFTSGSTGSPQACKLSYENLEASAQMISSSLSLSGDDVAITTLQPSYIYGLSIVFSHFFVGGSIILNREPIYSRNFWALVKQNPGVNFGAVPAQYQMLRNIYKDQLDLSGVKFLTQAGGALSQDVINFFKEKCSISQSKFYVMYGQTEASPRISTNCITDEKSINDSVGKVLKGGEVKLRFEPNQIYGELLYKGKNVFMGYAKSWTDLEHDKTPEYLETGDLALIDQNGFIYIKGRIKRIAKLNGLRINLDDLESSLEPLIGKCAIIEGLQDSIVIYAVNICDDKIITSVSKFLKLNKNNMNFTHINEIPLGLNQKTDYLALKRLSSKTLNE